MKVAEYYNNSYANHQLKADSMRIDRLRFAFEDTPREAKILNVGCGPGADIDFLLKAGNEVHGVDISDAALSLAEKRGIIPHKLDLTLLEELPLNDISFDVIIASDIFEHLFDPLHLLKECHRLLKPQGILLASVPNHFFWKMRLKILFGGDLILPFHPESNQWDYFHIRFFTCQGFEEMLRQGQFIVTRRYHDRFIITPRGLPKSIDKAMTRRFPDIFSLHFIVKAMKNSSENLC